MRELEKSRSLRKQPKDSVVFYGSSTIRLWESLAEDLGDRRAVNLGFGGSTLEACAHFFERLVTPLKPCSLVVYGGDNDLGDGRSPAEVLSFFKALAAKVDRELGQIEFGFISIKPSPARWNIADKIRLANKLIQQEAVVRARGYFIDIFDGMLGRDGKPERKYYEEDGLHLSPAGYRAWTKLLSVYRHRIFTLDCSSVKEERLPLTQSESRTSPVVQSEPEP